MVSGLIELWDLDSLTKIKTLSVGAGQYYVLSNLHFSPNGESLIAVTKESVATTRARMSTRSRSLEAGDDGFRFRRNVLWHRHIPTHREVLLTVGGVRVPRTMQDAFSPILAAGFFDNQTCWVIAGPTLLEWKISEDGIPERSKDRTYLTRDTIAVSQDRTTVAYSDLQGLITVNKFMHTLNHCAEEKDHASD